MNHEDRNLMLDPSFLLLEDLERPLERKLSEVGELANKHGFRIYAPLGLKRCLDDSRAGNVPGFALDQFVNFYVQGMPRTDLSRLYEVLDDPESPIALFDPEELYEDEDLGVTLGEVHRPFDAYLNRSLRELEGEGTEYWALREALFQEWVFLQEMSWIGAQTKAAFRTMVHAGSVSVEFGKRMAEKAVRRTRNLNAEDPITKLDVVMTTFKWTALGGIALSPTLFGVPQLGATIAGLVANRGFVLIDP